MRHPVLRLAGIEKSFAGVRVLSGVDLTLERGRAQAVVGESGAGKSTLAKIVTGAHRRDAGAISIEGRDVDLRSPGDAQRHGVVAVHQEIDLLAHRTVAENVLLGREPRRRFGLLDWARLNERAAEILGGIGLDVDPTATVGDLDVALRQMIAIARAVSLGARVLVLDEPTRSLTDREVDLLYQVIWRLKAEGTAIVYISHRLDDLFAVCDEVAILREGRLVASRPLAGLKRMDLAVAAAGSPH